MPTALADQRRFSRPAVYLHWAIFLLVAIAYLSIEIRGPKGSDSRLFWTATHLWVGASVLTLSFIRLGWRFYKTPPAPEPDNAILLMFAKATHLLLYIFIIAQPILGILMINLAGHPVTLAGLGSFSVVGENLDASKVVKWVHETLGNVFYFVIGLHILAALFHQFIKRDNILRRM